MGDLKSDICDAVDSLKDTLLGVSHHIHANPELAFEEVIAAECLTHAVEEAALPIQRRAYGLDTGYASEFGSDDSNGTVAILSEYDALPGIGHSCGHNIIAASGLGAALALSKVPGWKGKVRYVGTPAEERGGGQRNHGAKWRVRWCRRGHDDSSCGHGPHHNAEHRSVQRGGGL